MGEDIKTAAFMLFFAILLHGCNSKTNIYVDGELANPSAAYCAGHDLGTWIKEQQ